MKKPKQTFLTVSILITLIAGVYSLSRFMNRRSAQERTTTVAETFDISANPNQLAMPLNAPSATTAAGNPHIVDGPSARRPNDPTSDISAEIVSLANKVQALERDVVDRDVIKQLNSNTLADSDRQRFFALLNELSRTRIRFVEARLKAIRIAYEKNHGKNHGGTL